MRHGAWQEECIFQPLSPMKNKLLEISPSARISPARPGEARKKSQQYKGLENFLRRLEKPEIRVYSYS
jgi:hypothetical protein